MFRNFFSVVIISAMIAIPVAAQDESKAVSDGGVYAEGWTGQVDPGEAERGNVLENAKFSLEDGVFHVTTGPTTSYWNPENTASGTYTVMATFSEAEYMSMSNHPHPYGIFIGGNDMGTKDQTLLYCAAYGNGSFIVRGFGPEPFRLNGRRESNDAINKADDTGKPVTQSIAVTVTDDSVLCAINGTTVGTYAKSDVVGEGKLTSTDGVYGIRFGHNTSGTVTGFHSMNEKKNESSQDGP